MKTSHLGLSACCDVSHPLHLVLVPVLIIIYLLREVSVMWADHGTDVKVSLVWSPRVPGREWFFQVRWARKKN